MKVCIFGVGAIGSYLAAKLAAAGACEVSVVGRGAHLAAIQRNGLRLIEDGVVHKCAVTAVAHAQELPPQDIVFATVKACSLPDAAADLAQLTAPNGVVVFANNGIPWWWNHGLNEGDGALSRVDPGGVLWNGLGPERALGCVLYSANSIYEPGVVTHLGNNRWLLAEPTQTDSTRLKTVVSLMRSAGINAETSNDLRANIWGKLLRNAPFNTLCALTRLAASEFRQIPALVDLAQAMIDEVSHVAAAKGWNLPPATAVETVDSGGLIGGARQPGQGIPSMLTDALLERRMEIDAILGQVQAFAQEEGVETPNIDTVLAIVTGLDCSFALGTERLRQTQVTPVGVPA